MTEHPASRILIVDDSDMNIMILKTVLGKHGFDVVVADNGPTALKIAQAEIPDLIMLDIQMPQMDGFEVCQRLKADCRTQAIPVIFISALDNSEVILKGFEIGGVDYITKPFRFEEVTARVESHLTIVNQRRRIEQLLERERQEFEVINQMKNNFIGTATHDIKNPLFVILGYVKLMERKYGENPGIDEPLNGIRLGVNQITSLVSDMLDLIQLESGMQLDWAKVALAEFLIGAIEGFDILAVEKQIKLSFRPPPADLAVTIDNRWMQRVTSNLISNAIKYTPKGGQVCVSGYEVEGQALIEVSDTGLGIPEEAIPNLFDTFYRVPAHSDIEGTGLGLSIVKSIIDQHHGHIHVESAMGRGSRFFVALPMAG